jgi:hypothetical protein
VSPSASAARCAACPVGPGLRCPGPCGKAGTAPHWDAHIRAVAAATAPAPRADPAGPDAWLAPLRDPATGTARDVGSRPWEGRIARKPWEYRVTAAICHCDAPGPLAAVVATLRAQDEPPYILVYDAGSLAGHRPALEALEASGEDIQVCYDRPKAWRHTSEPVAVGMDWAWAKCRSEYLYSTHTDVFLKRPDYLSWLLARCDARTPAVGYQMSPREHGGDRWRRILSHTASLYHMPTLRGLGATWSLSRAAEMLGLRPEEINNGWPDTEVCLSLCTEAAGIGVRWPGDPAPGPDDPPSVLMIDVEPNIPYETEWLVHERSSTGRQLYFGLTDDRKARLAAAAEAAVRRAAKWTRDRALGRVRDCPDRGPVLPLSLQPAGCCGPGPEVSACGAGKGAVPGRVTLADCLACVDG